MKLWYSWSLHEPQGVSSLGGPYQAVRQSLVYRLPFSRVVITYHFHTLKRFPLPVAVFDSGLYLKFWFSVWYNTGNGGRNRGAIVTGWRDQLRSPLMTHPSTSLPCHCFPPPSFMWSFQILSSLNGCTHSMEFFSPSQSKTISRAPPLCSHGCTVLCPPLLSSSAHVQWDRLIDPAETESYFLLLGLAGWTSWCDSLSHGVTSRPTRSMQQRGWRKNLSLQCWYGVRWA